MRSGLPDFKAKSLRDQNDLGDEGVGRLLDAGRTWELAPILRDGGSIIFPHATITVCGHQVAAAVHACLDSGASRVLALGVLHALNDELESARTRVANGGDNEAEPAWGIQGPGVPGRDDWRAEFSLSHFQFLWNQETRLRGVDGPELILRYPFLVGSIPERLPGMDELRDIAGDSVIVATMDPFHHGVGYGDRPELALRPEAGGLDRAQERIAEGLELLRVGDYGGYNRHCVANRSDGRDVGQVLRHLLGPFEPEILDLVADDMTGTYQAPAPTWVASALISLRPQP